MIIDQLKRAPNYYGMSKRIEQALRYLADTDCAALSPGEHEIQGREVFAIVVDYETIGPQEAVYEAHRKYIDVQYVASGVESLGYGDIDGLKVTDDYNADKDVVFFEGNWVNLHVPAGTFVILFPQDAHRPCLIADKPSQVRKVVVKVAV